MSGMKTRAKMAALTLVALSTVTNAAPNDDKPLLLKVGEVNVIQATTTLRSGVVLDDEGTVHLLSMLGNGESTLLRMSRRGAVKQLIMYRGWPYILDNYQRLYALDVSTNRSLMNKIPYIALRSLKTLPLAIATGGVIYGLALLDQTFLGFVAMNGFKPSDAFVGGFLLFYGFDVTRTILLTSHRSIEHGGNFFTRMIARGVTEIIEDRSFNDYKIVNLVDGQPNTSYLSKLKPGYAGTSDCIEALTRLTLR